MTWKKRKQVSDKAHKIALPVYAHLFNVSKDSLFVSVASDNDDCKRGIDYYANILTQNLGWMQFSVQERFRRSEFMRYNDITLRYDAGNGFGELNFLLADYLLYGYYHEKNNTILRAYLIELPKVKKWILHNEQGLEKRITPTGERFVGVGIGVLFDISAIVAKYDNIKNYTQER